MKATLAAVLRGVLVVVGLAVIGYGVHGLLTMTRATHPPQAARWLIGAVLVHDLVAVPVTAIMGLLLTRFVRAPYRAVAQGALLVSATVALASLPLWRGYGGSPDNPTVNPLPYGRNLAIVLGAVWAGAAVVIAVRAMRARRTRVVRADPSRGADHPPAADQPGRRVTEGS
ncbi:MULTISPECIES: hypothetical protein [Pseudofrankia]|uniref:hypothetical protein n=1 Tax=Pseudofrankia TaxID=2994363 RepID=UPI000234CCF7|nr:MULTISPECIES: hypothetical protein [Pseudofrankia]OHV33387.1 hypothetical protein BCD49_27380 [Pseudofrankia sp. EUN1h]